MEIKSTLDAKAHINKIRHDKGLSESSPSGHNVSDLENALTTLSDQLYQSSTHFLLELIQNADDNLYASSVDPSVQFTYSDGSLRVDCNEIGFSPRNVEALCRVGQSTKKGGDNATRYVGEKGIGFKSVFKAADVVFVSSGHYSFKFDKSKQLGMIAPIWAEFPVPVKHGWTSFYLQLASNYNRRGLLDELRLLDSRLLIFLRRLRSITISISEPHRKIWISKFSRSEIGKDLIRLEENNKPCDYIITRHQVPNMPQESKRQGVSSSEIILGFPITQDGQPKRESQQAYAFLPIRDYGFEFLIQADFLLIASREDIDDSSEWNHALRSALTPAFIETMKQFNGNEKLRYLWPRYLPIDEPLQSFLQPFDLELRQKFRSHPILFSHSGDLAAPKALTYVPEPFTFNGAPLTISPQTSQRYLSARYIEEDIKYLDAIGVIQMSDDFFFDELKALLLKSMDKFKTKSNAWHSHLATILMRLGPEHSSQFGNLTLVPLSDKAWVAASNRQIVFPANQAEFELPGGLELSVIDETAATDPQRRKLFRYLGVGDLEREPVVRHIEKLHAQTTANAFNSIPNAALVSQINFLYSAGWKNPTFQRFWFTSESGRRLPGPQLYQDSTKPHSATKFFGNRRHRFLFIHEDYVLSAGSNRDLWMNWLEEKMGVATMPRLVESTSGSGFQLSSDFEFIIKNYPSSDILLLLRENWEEYSKFIDPEKAKRWNGQGFTDTTTSTEASACALTLKMKLGSMLVTGMDGKKHRLDRTFLPSKELLVASQDSVPFVDIPDGNNERWHALEMLGVSIKVDVFFYLRCLEKLQEEQSKDGDRVRRLLDTLQLRCDDEAEAAAIKKTFSAKSLVYIPSTREGTRSKWNSLTRCRWKGPPIGKNSEGLRSFDGLKDIYPENRRLFCDVLGVKDAVLSDLIHEVKYWAVGDSLEHYTGMLHTMEKLLEDETKVLVHTGLRALKTNKIFPVSKNWNLDIDRVSALQNASDATEWFIADTTPFRTMFAGIIPLLDFNVDDLPKMDQILDKIGLKDRFLSKHAESIPRIQGAVVPNQKLTDAFRSKVDFMIRLIHTTKSFRNRRREIVDELRNLEVFTSDEVIQEWCVTYKGKKVKGPSGNGKVAVVAEEGALKIYLAAKSGVDLDETPMELVDELFNFCGMQAHNPEHSEMCLHVAISQSNPSRISKVFADKGIPSLESLEFADADDKDSEDDEKDGAPPKYSEAEASGNAEKPGMSASKIIFAIPYGIVLGLRGILKREKHFDGEDKKIKSPKKAAPKKAKKPPKVRPPKNPRNGPNGLQKLNKSISTGFLHFQVALSPTYNEDVAFNGELAVHKALEEALGYNYNPRQHWTSKRRGRAKLPDFAAREDEYSTFKFSDVTGAFTQLLLNDQYPNASKWVTRPPTYHIDVKSTKGDIHAQFSMTPAQFKRARDLSIMMQQMKGDVDSIPNDVYILVRVFNVDLHVQSDDVKGKGIEVSNMVFLVDPWEYWHADRLVLTHKGKFTGSMI